MSTEHSAEKGAAFEKALAETRAEYREALDRLTDSAAGHPSPSKSEWNAWATFTNQVSAALRGAGVDALFSKRRRVAEELWALGYRPSVAQIAELIEQQHARVTPPTEPEGVV